MTQSIAIKPNDLPIGKITASECTIEIGGGICGGAFTATRFQPIPSIKLIPQANDALLQRIWPLIERAEPIHDVTVEEYTWDFLPNVQRAWLRADPAAVESYRAKLQAYPRPWVGFNWAGGDGSNPLRNIEPAYCKPEILALPGTLIDIQHQPSAAFDERVSRMRDFCQQIGRPLTRPDGFDPVADLADGAALFQVLDAVLAVDCTHAHLTPALGTPTFVIGRYARRGIVNDVGISATLNPEQWCNTLELITPAGSDSWKDVLNQAAEKLTTLFADIAK